MGINRGTVLDLINDVHRAGGFKDYNSYSYLFNQVDTMPESKEDAEPHWIPVTERLPYAEYGESDNVLATCGYRDVEDGSIRWIKTLYFNGGNWCYPTGETYLEKVYAWMPLPEPMRMEKQ